MLEIENKIREYGQKRDQRALESYIENLSTEDLIKLIQARIYSPNFVHVWDYMLKSFTDSLQSHRKRHQIVFALLQELEKGGLSSLQSNSIITRLCTEFPKFKPQHLIDLCNFYIESIQKGKSGEMCWKEILPDILNVLAELESLEYNDNFITGQEYKSQLITSLCMLVWSPNIVTSVTSMFIEMPLTKEEHSQVVNKLGQYMEKLSCQEVPAFIYQLLKLCRYQNSRSIFLRLQNYFGTRIYSKLNLEEENSESTNADDIGSASDQEAIEVESTVLFHIHQCAEIGSESIKDYLASLKNMTKSPEFVLHPFQFTVLLTISSISYYEDRVMEILRMCICRAIQENYKKSDSCWFREMVASTCKVEDILAQVIDCCSLAERYLVVQGLVQLAYALLGVGASLSKEGILMAGKQWHLGKMIILKVIKKKRSIAHCIISSLNKRIVTGQNVSQYIDCIYTLSHKMSSIMLENQSCVIEMMEYLVQVPGPVAEQLLDAILPLTKLSPTIRDQLILLLRKALYSRVIATRQTAVLGFLKLIKNLKISNLAALSQSSSSSSFSGHSLLTQVSLTCTGRNSTNVFSNEALCLEVLGILCRCFMQEAEVRAKFYDGLYDAVCANPELGISVLDVIWTHFSNLYVEDENSLPPFRFSKITATKDVDVKLLEPLGNLVYAIALIVTKLKEEDEDNPTITKFTAVLESLCTRMVQCELIHFEVDDGTDLLDIIPEAQQKQLILKEAISVYEALIGYKICSWGPQSENNGQQINGLFQGYNRLVEFAKNLLKPKKGEKGKKKGSANTTTQQSQNTTTGSAISKSKSLKLPKTILDFQTFGKVLHLLHENEVRWTTPRKANVLKGKVDFHRYVMESTMQLLQRLKRSKSVELKHAKMYYNYMAEIAGILYDRCITRLIDFIDFDRTTAVMATECFYLLLVVVTTHYKNNLSVFLAVVAGENKDEELVPLLTLFITTYQNLFEKDFEEMSSDPEIKKLPLIILNTLNLLANQIPTTSSALSIQFSTWLKNYMNDNTLCNKQVAAAFMPLMFNMQIKFKASLTLFENVAMRLSEVIGTINEVKPDAEEPKLIDDVTALSIFPLFCNSIKTMLDDMDWLILRLRAEYSMITYPGEDNPERRREYLKSKERGICCQLCPLATIVGILCNVAVSPGNLVESLLKTVAHLYNSLNSLTKYFMLRSSKINLAFQAARFEQVVKLTGKRLTTIVYNFIVYIEDCQKQQTQAKKDTTALKSKVLRETRSIPKVIYEIEQFGKSVMQLANKTKVDLAKYIGQGTARDFRIKGIKEVLEKIANEPNVSFDDTTVEDAGLESDNRMEVDQSGEEDEQSGDDAAPPKKKTKT